MSLARLLKKGGLQGRANANSAKPAKDGHCHPSTLATLATLALATCQKQAANDPAPKPTKALDTQIQAAGLLPGNDPDGDCWPHSTAMTGAEIDTFAARLARFTTKGVIQIDAESLADKLVTRDREQDDRRLCLECTHLGGYGASSWRCGNWQAAKVAHRARDVQLPADLVRKLQRCDGFNSFNPTTKASI